MSDDQDFRIQSKAVLLTYQGLPVEEEGPTRVNFSELQNWLDNHDCLAYSLCEEVANRRHYHVYIQYDSKINKKKHQFAVNGQEPNDVQVNRATKNYNRACADGHFYVYCKFKKSHVQSHTTATGVPTCRTIYNLCREDKMDPEKALECATYYKMVEGLAAMKRDIDSLLQLAKRKRQEEYIAICQKKSRLAINRPFKAIPEISRWLGQYIYYRDRYDFLLLVGPSKMGKTQYAKHLLPNAIVFEQSTNWRDFDPFLHKGIIFDDVCHFDDESKSIFQYIVNNKALFQACASPVTLGKSKTGIFEYNVCVYKQPIIVCCNFDNFESRSSWIDANACIYKVHDKMYL